MKIVINVCYGGFGLSRKALHRLRELKSPFALEETDIGEAWKDNPFSVREESLNSFLSDIPRDDLLLVKVVEELGKEAYGGCARLRVVEIPDGVDWEIDDYDGLETIREKHRSWR